MSLGAMTRQSAEARMADMVNTALQALWNANQLGQRLIAEDGAGTLDAPGWYQGDPADKSNMIGTANQVAALLAYLEDKDHPLPTAAGADPLGYARFLIGNA